LNLNEVPVILSIDPEFRDLIPPLTQEEQQGLLESILEEGCRDPIIVHNNTIIDGHNRYEICREMHIPFRTAPFPQENPTKDDLKIWIIKNQFARRNITNFQRADLALELEPLIAAKAKEKQREHGGTAPGRTLCQISDEVIDTKKELAKIAGVSHDTIAKVKKIRSRANGDLIKKVQSGEVSINEAYKTVRAGEKAEQKQIAIDQINAISEPNGLYHVLVVDPPWQYSKRAEDATHRGRCIYPTMSIEEISAMNLPDEDDAVLWLWTTNAFMHEAYHVLDSWGYIPKTILTWVKDRMGVGDWLRGQSEHCILAVKGRPVINLTNQTTVLNAPLREHSRKPDEFYNMVGALCPGKKIDIFSREPREGWDQWGCEIDKF